MYSPQSDFGRLQPKAKLAIISLSTFGYFERMAARASFMGVETHFFDERPVSNTSAKLFFRIMPRFVKSPFVENHLDAICNKILAENFTHVLIIFAELIDSRHILKLKAGGLQVSRYTWDSLSNRSSVLKLDPLMTSIGSFDPDDCKARGYSYIPLYSEIVPKSPPPSSQRPTDFYFCGTMHSNRPNYISKITKIASDSKWNIQLKLFYHSRWMYLLRNLFSWRAILMLNTLSTQGFSHNEILNDMAKAKVVIDIQHPKQSGLTMRTFEAIAQGSIVLTTNKLSLVMLNPNLRSRVFILDNADIQNSMNSALAADLGSINEEQRYALSIERFITQIFELCNIKLPKLPE